MRRVPRWGVRSDGRRRGVTRRVAPALDRSCDRAGSAMHAGMDRWRPEGGGHPVKRPMRGSTARRTAPRCSPRSSAGSLRSPRVRSGEGRWPADCVPPGASRHNAFAIRIGAIMLATGSPVAAGRTGRRRSACDVARCRASPSGPGQAVDRGDAWIPTVPPGSPWSVRVRW